MAVRRLGQSVADLLCRRHAVMQARSSICIAQQRGMAGSSKQKDVNGIPVEVGWSLPSPVIAKHTSALQPSGSLSLWLSLFSKRICILHFWGIVQGLPGVNASSASGAHSFRPQIPRRGDKGLAWRQMAPNAATSWVSSGHLQTLRHHTEPGYHNEAHFC